MEENREEISLEDDGEIELEKLGILKLILISIFWLSNSIYLVGLSYIIVPKYVDTTVSNDIKGTVLGFKILKKINKKKLIIKKN